MFKKSKKVTLNVAQKEPPKQQSRTNSSDVLDDEDVSDATEVDQRTRMLFRHSRTGSLDRKKRHNAVTANKPRAPAKSSQAKQQDVLAVNHVINHARKHSVPDNIHKPPSPKDNDVGVDPLLVDKSKQLTVSSSYLIRPPFMQQALPALQQQQKILISQSKPSPPLTNKNVKSTAIPRKPTTSLPNTRNYADLENQMGIPMSNSNDEISSLLEHTEPPPPSPTIVEDQQDGNFSYLRYSSNSNIQQQPSNLLPLQLVDQYSPKLTSPPKLATFHGQRPSAIPVQNIVHYHSINKPQQQQPMATGQPLPRGVEKRYPPSNNGVPSGITPFKQSTSPVPPALPMSPKYPAHHNQAVPPSKLPVATATAAGVVKNGVPTAATTGVPTGSRLRVVEKAMRARLYLMEQPGPNIFLVTGDSNESRFRVIVGPQKCSCGKTECIHLLFVMLRVLKVSQNDVKLWSKELKNYEVESLLSSYLNRRLMSPNKRNSMRRTKSVPARQHSYASSSSVTGSFITSASEGGSSLQLVFPVSGNINESGLSDSKTLTATEMACEGQQVFVDQTSNLRLTEGTEVAGFEIEEDEEDEMCPICLLEIVEGEDLVECVKGCHIELHKHCMEVWATEQRRRGDNAVKCPVCMATWDRVTVLPSSMHSLASPPVTMASTRNQDASFQGDVQTTHSDTAAMTPATSTPAPLLRQRSYSRVDNTSSFFLDHFLTEKLFDYLLKLQEYVSKQCLDQIFSSNWKSREAGLQHLARDIVSLLMPTFTHHPRGSGQPSHEEVQRSSIVQCALEACCPVISHSCTDAVLKVYLAALELCRVILCNSLCDCQQNVEKLRVMFKPILSVILVRCADAQSRARECSLDFLHHLCLGQAGPLALGSACGNPSTQEFGGTDFVCSLALERPPTSRLPSGHWWLGRLLFLEHALLEFDVHFRPPKLSLVSSTAPADTSPLDDLLLVKVCLFASAATHAQHQKVTKVAIRVYKRSTELSLDCPQVLERVKVCIEQCHGSIVKTVREVIGRLLAQKGITKAHKKHRKYGINRSGVAFRDKRSAESELELSLPRPDESDLAHDLSKDYSKSFDTSSELEELAATPEVLHLNRSQDYREEFVTGNVDMMFHQPVYVESRYSHQRTTRNDSSCSELGVSQDGQPTQTMTQAAASSNGSSDVPKLTTSESSSDHVSSGEHHHIGSVMARQFSMTVEGVTNEKSHITEQSQTDAADGHCKREVEEEEAMALAQVQSMVEADRPHPPISIAPPSETVVVHVQPDAEDVVDGKYTVYRQDNEWAKGKPIGSGAYCSCFLAQDIQTGTIMAAKQVSYIRNTPLEEEEEQKRLTKEVSMLAKLQHPNIVRCLGATQQPGCFNIFMEWMAGGSVERLLHDFGAFHPLVVANYTRQIVFGLSFLHSHGIIHRDLKGANILVDSTGQRVRIADLGAAARLAAQVTEDDEFRNDVQGTVPFMAPEVVRGEHYGRSCDVWSVGCCIIQMATGRPPWNATGSTNKFALIYKIATATDSPPMPDGLTVEVRDLGIRCLELKPEDRPKSADLLKHALFRGLSL